MFHQQDHDTMLADRYFLVYVMYTVHFVLSCSTPPKCSAFRALGLILRAISANSLLQTTLAGHPDVLTCLSADETF